MNLADLQLLPMPRTVALRDGTCTLPPALTIRLAGAHAHTLVPAATRLQARLRPLGVAAELSAAPVAAPVELAVDGQAVAVKQGYTLSISPTRVRVVGHDLAGLRYGIATLLQLLAQYGRALPALEIADHPDFPARGVMLDISRDKVPTLATLMRLVERLADLKLNQVQLYTEHTFAYTQHQVVWQDASPITPNDILTLDAHCAALGIELVPNQNSFGHVERYLKHDAYRYLAECPTGFDYPWGGRSNHGSTLNPLDPASVEFLHGLYAELLPNFRSPLFNVGCDETWELGKGRSAAACEARGTTRVYLDFLLKIRDLAHAQGRTMMFWGDIIMHHPELIAELPKDVIALEWGYEASHPFAEHGAKFAASGVPFYVCPGTSSWNSLAGRTANAIGNLKSAALNGRANGAIGFLNTDWGDNGHWQYLPISYLGFAYGAAYSWAADANTSRDLVPALSRQVFGDGSGALGQLAYELGNVYQEFGKLPSNSTMAHHLLFQPIGSAPPDAETSEAKLLAAAASVEGIIARLAALPSGTGDDPLVPRELAAAAKLVLQACHQGLFRWAAENDGATAGWARLLETDLRQIVATHRELWLARNRPGGLADSLARLEPVIASFDTWNAAQP